MAADPISEVMQHCQDNVQQLRNMAQAESRSNIKKMLSEAAHELDVAMAELDYILTDSTVPI